MAYFPNGTQGEMYQQEYCCQCIHFDNCPIWLAHLMHNGDEWLNIFIPRSGTENLECNMFVEGSKPIKQRTLAEEQDLLWRWLHGKGLPSGD